MKSPGELTEESVPMDRAASEPPISSVSSVTHRFGASRKSDRPATVLADVTLDISRGSIVCLVGPSGCGKTTLLNIIAGLIRPTAGEVRFAGQPSPTPNTHLGYITQRDNLLPWRTVERNVGVALEIKGVDRSERHTRIAEMLDLVGLGEFGKYYPEQLSGGMRKRVALCRTFVYRPEMLLMDEPFGALDAVLKVELQSSLMDLCARGNHTVVFVTHDLDEAVAIGDRVLVFGAKPGRIIHEEPISMPRPRDMMLLRSDPKFGEIVGRLWSVLRTATEDLRR